MFPEQLEREKQRKLREKNICSVRFSSVHVTLATSNSAEGGAGGLKPVGVHQTVFFSLNNTLTPKSQERNKVRKVVLGQSDINGKRSHNPSLSFFSELKRNRLSAGLVANFYSEAIFFNYNCMLCPDRHIKKKRIREQKVIPIAFSSLPLHSLLC